MLTTAVGRCRSWCGSSVVSKGPVGGTDRIPATHATHPSPSAHATHATAHAAHATAHAAHHADPEGSLIPAVIIAAQVHDQAARASSFPW